MMKDRRRRDALGGHAGRHPRPSLAPPVRCGLFLLLFCALLSTVIFSTFSLVGVTFRPILISRWQAPVLNSVFGSDGDDEHFFPQPTTVYSQAIHVYEAVSFPDQLLIFFNDSLQSPAQSLTCLYYPPSSSKPDLRLPPITTPAEPNILRCAAAPGGFSVSVSDSLKFPLSLPLTPKRWDHLVYAAILDGDNSTLIFVKGLNHRAARLADATRYECVFGWRFHKQKYILTAPAISAAQEIVRCHTPLSVVVRAVRQPTVHVPYASLRVKGRGGFTFPSVARPEGLPITGKGKNMMCVCTMLRNQARFIKEWILYHSRIGVDQWLIYDNNSEDDIEQVIESLGPSLSSRIVRRLWPWIKTQEAGFAHCALHARELCEWVGFIDVDEFLYLPTDMKLHDVLQNYSRNPVIAELRTSCHTFGPSGHKTPPPDGLMTGYTCRMAAPERHKSIVHTESLNPSLINVVHHFHLKAGKRYVNMDRGVMVINHYKYQVWDVFKEKFYRRVATYVADWQDEENAGSKDRAPGLGTKPLEPPDWPSKFCEVNDTGLRDWVLRSFTDPETGQTLWSEGQPSYIQASA